MFVVFAFVCCACLTALSLIPVWPYDWEPPPGATADSDLIFSDILCASVASVIAAAAALIGRGFASPRARRAVYVGAAVLLLLNLARIAMLVFSARPWPDFS